MTTPPPPGTTGEPVPSAPEGATPTTAPAEPVYLVAGGDMVAVFDNHESADIMFTTMTGANLVPEMLRLTVAQWDRARAVLAEHQPHITVTDARAGRDGGTR